MFSTAKQAQIIRCVQKDDFHSSFIKSSISEIAQDLFGPRSWLQWRKEVELLADILYFSLTTFAGYQTLGEEYVNILQVDPSLRRIPSQFMRASMILMQVTMPYCLDHLLNFLQQKISADHSGRDESGQSLLTCLSLLRHIIPLVHRCHLAMFYMNGLFYHVAKRLVGIQYIQVRPKSSQTSASNYRILGILSLVQLGFTFLQHVYKQINSMENKSNLFFELVRNMTNLDKTESAFDKVEKSTQVSRKCSLCLDSINHTTTTPCGHLFCWECIVEWCNNKSECPLCREKFVASRLVYLQNFDLN